MMNISSSRSHPWLSLFAWLLPASSLKTWALRKLGNDIADDAIIGPNLVIGCGRFRVGVGTVIDRSICSGAVTGGSRLPGAHRALQPARASSHGGRAEDEALRL
jgi:hypothetical protein